MIHINSRRFRIREREDRYRPQALRNRDKWRKGARAFVFKQDFKHCSGMINPQPRNNLKHLLEGGVHLNIFPLVRL